MDESARRTTTEITRHSLYRSGFTLAQPVTGTTHSRNRSAYRKVLVVDECRKTGGMAEPIMALLAEHSPGLIVQRVAGWDTYIPLGDAANLVLVQEPDIEQSVLQLVNGAQS